MSRSFVHLNLLNLANLLKPHKTGWDASVSWEQVDCKVDWTIKGLSCVLSMLKGKGYCPLSFSDFNLAGFLLF